MDIDNKVARDSLKIYEKTRDGKLIMNSSQNFNLDLSQGLAGVGQSNETASKRFLELSEEELNELKKKTVRKSTISVTNTSVNTFKKFFH